MNKMKTTFTNFQKCGLDCFVPLWAWQKVYWEIDRNLRTPMDFHTTLIKN